MFVLSLLPKACPVFIFVIKVSLGILKALQVIDSCSVLFTQAVLTALLYIFSRDLFVYNCIVHRGPSLQVLKVQQNKLTIICEDNMFSGELNIRNILKKQNNWSSWVKNKYWGKLQIQNWKGKKKEKEKRSLVHIFPEFITNTWNFVTT